MTKNFDYIKSWSSLCYQSLHMSPEVKKLVKHDAEKHRIWIVWNPSPIYEQFKRRFVSTTITSENNVAIVIL